MMARHRTLGVLVTAGLAVTIIAVVLGTRGDDVPKPDPLQVARQTLRETRDAVLRSSGSHPSASQAAYVAAIDDALQRTDGLTGRDIRAPMLVWGEFFTHPKNRSVDGTDQWQLALHWLDPDFDVAGLYVVDDTGRRHVFNDVLNTNKDAQTLMAVTALRVVFLLVANPVTSQPSGTKAIALDPMLLRGRLNIGLISKNGIVHEPRQAFINDGGRAEGGHGSRPATQPAP